MRRWNFTFFKPQAWVALHFALVRMQSMEGGLPKVFAFFLRIAKALHRLLALHCQEPSHPIHSLELFWSAEVPSFQLLISFACTKPYITLFRVTNSMSFPTPRLCLCRVWSVDCFNLFKSPLAQTFKSFLPLSFLMICLSLCVQCKLQGVTPPSNSSISPHC